MDSELGLALHVHLWARHKPLQARRYTGIEEDAPRRAVPTHQSQRAPLVLQVVQWLCGRTALTVAVQEAVLQVLDADPLLASAPLEPAYRQRLVKHLISAVERDSGRAELCEALVGAYTELLAQPPGAPDSTPAGTDRGAVTWMVKTFVYSSGGEAAAASGCLHGSAAFADALAAHAQRLRGALQEPAGEQQRCRGADAAQASAQLAPGDPPGLGLVSLRVSSNVLDGGTGCAEWEAGLVLAEVVLSHPRLVQGERGDAQRGAAMRGRGSQRRAGRQRGAYLCGACTRAFGLLDTGRRCLELGCGTGVVGMAAARAGAQHVRLTDGDAGAMANCTFNCRLNGLVADLEEQQQGEAAAATGRSELRGHHKGRVQVRWRSAGANTADPSPHSPLSAFLGLCGWTGRAAGLGPMRGWPRSDAHG